MPELEMFKEWFYVNSDKGTLHWAKAKQKSRIQNLREVSKFQNLFNRSKPKNNSSGYKGVYFQRKTGKWVAQIAIREKPKNLGSFYTLQEAVECRQFAAEFLYPDFARHI